MDVVRNESTGSGTATAPQGADDAVGVSGDKWFVAIVTPRHEKSVAAKLLQLNVKSYAATQKEMRVWANGRRRVIDRVVISSIVFVHCTEARRRQIVKLPYISRFMVDRAVSAGTLCRPVAVIPDEQIRKLMFMLGQSDTPVDFEPTQFKINDNVRVMRGPLRGLEGEITENPDGTHTLTVSLSVLGGARVKIDPLDVELLGTRRD